MSLSPIATQQRERERKGYKRLKELEGKVKVAFDVDPKLNSYRDGFIRPL